MKRLIFLELIFLFLATTFSSNPPPGWYQQTLPVDDFVNDIFFLDSLNGWVVTAGEYNADDTAYILQTTDGGENWSIQYSGRENLSAIQFLDLNTGYACGGTNGTTLMTVLKTTNRGKNWLTLNNITGIRIDDIDFINTDTGWVSAMFSDFGGIWKTTNGGQNWAKQLNGSLSVQIKAINFLNKDTGWAISNGSTNLLYRTINGGVNWNVQYTFGGQLNDVLFLNQNVGIISAGVNYRTSNGGYNWVSSNEGGIKLSFANDSTGWAGDNLIYIIKTSNGGNSWFDQITNVNNPSTFAVTSLNAWAGGNKLIHTTDGGPLSIIQNNINSPINYVLFQNYPNPFNPNTVINYELRITGYVKLKVYDIQGKEVETLIDEKKNEGNYKVEFDGSDLNSGVYFYRIEILNERNKELYIESKKMLLIR